MSTFEVPVVLVGVVEKHPNADTLSVTRVFDYPVILRTGDFAPGDLAVYVPVEAVVPDTQEWVFLGGHRRIKAKRLRGVFSMGLLVKPPAGAKLGENLAERMGITKYEQPAELSTGGDNERDPGFMPVYTDIENLRRWPNKLFETERVTASEKLHGANSRFLHRDGRLWVGSRTGIKKDSPTSIWWQAARRYDLAAKLAKLEGFAVYGEVFGQVQDLKYGAKPGEVFFRAFDVYDTYERYYLNADEAAIRLAGAEIEMVPEVVSGVWSEVKSEAFSHAGGRSTLADNVCEGIVIRPEVERHDEEVGRVIFKLISDDYLLRKGGTEHR